MIYLLFFVLGGCIAALATLIWMQNVILSLAEAHKRDIAEIAERRRSGEL